MFYWFNEAGVAVLVNTRVAAKAVGTVAKAVGAATSVTGAAASTVTIKGISGLVFFFYSLVYLDLYSLRSLWNLLLNR